MGLPTVWWLKGIPKQISSLERGRSDSFAVRPVLAAEIFHCLMVNSLARAVAAARETISSGSGVKLPILQLRIAVPLLKSGFR